jgi:hypothetical protein
MKKVTVANLWTKKNNEKNNIRNKSWTTVLLQHTQGTGSNFAIFTECPVFILYLGLFTGS